LQQVYASNSWKLLSTPRAIVKILKKVMKNNG